MSEIHKIIENEFILVTYQTAAYLPGVQIYPFKAIMGTFKKTKGIVDSSFFTLINGISLDAVIQKELVLKEQKPFSENRHAIFTRNKSDLKIYNEGDIRSAIEVANDFRISILSKILCNYVSNEVVVPISIVQK